MTGGGAGSVPADFEGYDDVRKAAAVECPRPAGLLAIAGRDALTFLQGVLTNDVLSLGPGGHCYAAHLTAQGRMVSDMEALRRPDDFLLVVEPAVATSLAARLDQSIFTEDVRVEDRSPGVQSLAVHGPAAHEACAGVFDPGERPAIREALSQGRHVSIPGAAGDVTLYGGTWLGVRGVRFLGPEQAIGSITDRLAAAGHPSLGVAALLARRIEAGLPLFGTDMTTDTIPLEAGIEERAISTTKGCYVGQEIVVRILHRAHGRVARRLMGLEAEGPWTVTVGAGLFADGRDVGAVTSVGWSPGLGRAVALAIVHRDASEPGTVVAVGGLSGQPATVRALPLLPPLPDPGH